MTAQRRGIFIAAGAVIVALVVAVFIWGFSGSDSATTTSTTIDPNARPPQFPELSGLAGSTTAATLPPGPAPPKCTVDSNMLLSLLKSQKLLAPYASTLKLSGVRCSEKWASGVVGAKDTDNALALFENDGAKWRVLLFGSSDPCAGQGISAASQVVLGCGDWP